MSPPSSSSASLEELATLPVLTPRQKAILKRAGLIQSSEVLLPSYVSLLKILQPGVTDVDVRDLVQAVARAVCPAPTRLLGIDDDDSVEACTDSEMGLGSGRSLRQAECKSMARVRFGDDEIDGLLGGGIQTGVITELAGESGAGKSQLCMLLSLSCQLSSFHSTVPIISTASSSTSSALTQASLPSTPLPFLPTTSLLGGSCCYISSEGRLPISRINAFAASLLSRYPQSPLLGTDVDTLRDNVHFLDCNDIEALEHTFSYLLPALIARLAERPLPPPRNLSSSPHPPFQDSSILSPGHSSLPPLLPLRVIILDSLAALIRVSFPSTGAGLSLRSAAFANLADKLKSLAATHNLAVLVVNQVSDLFNDPWDRGDLWSTREEAEAERQMAQEEEEEEERVMEVMSGMMDRSRGDLNGNGKRKSSGRQTGEQDSNLSKGRVVLSFPDQAKWFNGSSPSFGKEASLGLTWSNCVDTRIMLSRTTRYRLVESPPSSNPTAAAQMESGLQSRSRKELIRRMHLVFGSGSRGGGRVDYIVGEGEVRGLKDDFALGRDESGDSRRKRARREVEGLWVEGGEAEEDEEFGDVGWLTQIPEDKWSGMGE